MRLSHTQKRTLGFSGPIVGTDIHPSVVDNLEHHNDCSFLGLVELGTVSVLYFPEATYHGMMGLTTVDSRWLKYSYLKIPFYIKNTVWWTHFLFFFLTFQLQLSTTTDISW